MKTHSLEVQSFIDSQRFSPYQWRILILCFLVVAADGFDTAAVGFIAPSLLGEWGITRAALGPVMSAALVGLGIGALAAGPAADRIGRKAVLVLSVFFFGVWSLASAHASSIESLTAWRFLTGLGLGAAMPNAVTLMSEYAPARIRGVAVNAMFCGFSVGLSIGGLSAAWLIPHFGWQSVLVTGGVGPLVLAALLVALLPESAQFMVVRKRPAERIARVLRRISSDPRLDDSARIHFVAADTKAATEKTSAVSLIVSRPYRFGTAMLWLAYFTGLMIYYLLTNWLPTLFKDAGFTAQGAALTTSLFPLGGILGNLCLGWVMDRTNPRRVNACAYVVSAALVLVIGSGVSDRVWLAVLIFLTGTAVTSAVTSMSALAAAFYPTQGRATGVAWMLGVGRMGAVAGAMTGGVMMSMGLPFGAVFMLLAVPAFVAALALFALGGMRMPGFEPALAEKAVSTVE
ncbi:aromatic acid/H+ symport family MFS transporter [Caballeronia sp. LZ033]|uniref:MFS transporter n=1 Tax=Caballeronia sp. LZ033 TaxID=3038566 RepID=UPI0028559259|nr:aromatic acid/H+ symport family MFS transporter [Caballeronia sp. LZ033]MDR5815513.1 aromatic acid/H+ symport family MFS transporter [Caballeronia sp. LZ033]